MSTPITSSLTPAYTCKHCRKTLTLNGPPIIGEKPLERMARVAQLMANHLGQEHQKEMLSLGFAGQQVVGWLITEQFTHNDSELAKTSDKARLQFRRNTQRVHVSDEMIEKQVDAHFDWASNAPISSPRQTVITLLKTMRDAIEEGPTPPAA